MFSITVESYDFPAQSIGINILDRGISKNFENDETSSDSINGQRISHKRYEKRMMTLETVVLTKEQAQIIKDFLVTYGHKCNISGIFNGTFDVDIPYVEYQFFYVGNNPYIGGQRLNISVEEYARTSKV